MAGQMTGGLLETANSALPLVRIDLGGYFHLQIGKSTLSPMPLHIGSVERPKQC